MAGNRGIYDPHRPPRQADSHPHLACALDATALRRLAGRFWTDVDGITLIDVAGPERTLACRLASARQAAPSTDADWTHSAPAHEKTVTGGR